MENLLVNFSKTGLKENQAYLKVFLSEKIKKITNDDTKDYYRAFLNQAIEFSIVQLQATFETRPLLQFYSLLNLVKFYILSKDSCLSTINTDEIYKKFQTHGASSSDNDKIKLQETGIASEFARVLGQTVSKDRVLSLLDLYKRIPELSLKLKKLDLSSDDYDFKKIQYPVKFYPLNGNFIINSFEYFQGNCADKSQILSVYNAFSEENSDGCTFLAKINENKQVFSKRLTFDVNGEYYLDTKKDDFCELFALYLVFLKYSSLSRYRPYDWYKKLHEKETVIIEYTMDNLFEKFWALITKDLSNLDKCIL